MHRFFALLLFFCSYIFVEGQAAISPSGTLPVLYIKTKNQTPVDQREFYIEATTWLDSSMIKEFESLGSEKEPVSLGIRGRGNATWGQSDQKPYKLRFDEKQSILGSKKNRHYALLHLQGPMTSFFHEPLAFRAAELLGEPWVPMCEPCEVVLNGEYRGLYFLTETVRVGKDRVDVTEQKDGETDPEKIDSGWLVEIDNNSDTNQTELLEPNGRNLLLTFKSPEILSEPQLKFIEGQFKDIIHRVHNSGGVAGDWLDLIDGESLARHYIINEIMQNYDGFCGSWYWYKDKETKWLIGPPWDYGYALQSHGEGSYLKFYEENARPNLIREMLNSYKFRLIVKRVWIDFYSLGTTWVDNVVDDWTKRIEVAGKRNFLRWGVGNDLAWIGSMAASRLKHHIEWFNEYINSDGFNLWSFSKIEDINSATYEEDMDTYDLMGRKISPSVRRRGIYVRGNKIFVQ